MWVHVWDRKSWLFSRYNVIRTIDDASASNIEIDVEEMWQLSITDRINKRQARTWPDIFPTHFLCPNRSTCIAWLFPLLLGAVTTFRDKVTWIRVFAGSLYWNTSSLPISTFFHLAYGLGHNLAHGVTRGSGNSLKIPEYTQMFDSIYLDLGLFHNFFFKPMKEGSLRACARFQSSLVKSTQHHKTCIARINNLFPGENVRL